MTKTKNHILYIYLSFFLLTVLFFSKNEALTNNGVVIPFININPVYLLLAILLLGFLYTLFQAHFVIDAISGILLLRFFLCLIPLAYIDVPSSYWGNLVDACFPFLIYTFFLNHKFQIEKAVRIFIFFGIILGLQCFLAYSTIINSGYATYFDLWYKNYFVIPAGATNDLSATLLSLLILGDLTIEKKRYRWPFVLLMVISIALTKSRTGVILSILFFLAKLFIKEKGHSNLWKRILIVVLPIVLVITFLNIPKNSAIFQGMEMFFSGFADSDNNSINGLLSGRLDVFSNVIHEIGKHPIFGNGVTYVQLQNMRSHNAFLGILYENGMVGLLFFFVFLYIAFKRIIKMRNCNKYYYAFFIVALFIFINSMVEEILFRHSIVLLGLMFLASMKRHWKDEEINHV